MRAPLLRDVATISRTQGPVEVYHHDADRVSQLFVSVGDSNLARVAGEIDRIVEELPLTYAVTILPKDALLAHAIKAFPAGRGDPREDPVLEGLLRAYFHDEEPEVAEDLRNLYDVDVDSLHLGKSPRFREQLEKFLGLTKAAEKQKARADIQQEFGVDPEPLRLPKGVRVTIRGEVASMRESFAEMGFNLALAVLLVYLVMAAQFSSWLDPLIMIVAAPLGLVGVVAMLWATGTSLNIQSLMGVLLMIGISVSNSVLLVEFANHLRAEGKSTFDADRRGGAHAAAADPDDDDRDHSRPVAHGASFAARRRDECAAGPRRDRRPGGFDAADAVCRAGAVRAVEAGSGRVHRMSSSVAQERSFVPEAIEEMTMKHYLMLFGILLMAFCVPATGCEKRKAGKPRLGEVERLPRVETVVLGQPAKLEVVRTYTATVEALEKADVCAMVKGYIKVLPADLDIGREVKKTMPLFSCMFPT